MLDHSLELLDRIHARVVSNVACLRLALITRVLLAIGFVAPGLTKLLGRRFMLETDGGPIPRFFEALYQTGLYWRFLGAVQVLAALLVLIRPTRTIGAFLFFGIILNIFVITVALDFGNTEIVAGLMVLASLYLVAWDYPRWRSLFGGRPALTDPPWPAKVGRLELCGYGGMVLGGWLVLSVMRGLPGRVTFWSGLALGLASGLLVLGIWIRGVVRVVRARS